ncbi:MAG TPA: sugar ABC transporter permease [Thermomicrobiales bacterium]|nr:sugar ABC transporter permease [Thermomicrobiales bacterium]
MRTQGITTPRARSGMERMEQRWGLLLGLPAMLGFIIFTIGPMVASGWISLTDWNIYGDASFVGLDNYREMLTEDPLFFKSLWVTLYYTFASVPLLLLVAFAAALLLNADVRGKAIFRTIFYLPVLVPLIANTILWTWLFNPDFGLFNTSLEQLGLPTSMWLYDERTVIPSLILMAVWGFGNATVIFLAGLQGVPAHLYEAVEVDGGGLLDKLRHVTIPMMTPTIFFNLVLGMIGSFQAFAEAYAMTNGGPNNASLFYVFYLYRTAFTESRMGYASALSWVLFLVILLFTVLIFRSARSWVYYEGNNAS